MRIRQTALNMVITLALTLSWGMAASAPAHAAPAHSPTHHHASPSPSSPSPSSPSPQPSASACPDTATAKGQVLQGLGVTGSDCSDGQVNQTINTVVSILSIVIGVASVVVIMVSGFKYIVSAGEQNKVANAKSSLIYALVGLAVAAAAQLLIHFVLRNTNAT